MENFMKFVKAILKSLLTFSFPFLISSGAVFAQGNALSFDGSTSATFSNPVSGDFTIEFWINTTTFSGSEGNWYWGAGLVDGEVGGVTNDFGVSLTNGKIAFGVGHLSEGSDQTITGSKIVSDGYWHHVAAVRTQSTGDMKLYIDGVLNGNATGSTEQLTAPSNLAIGKIQTDINYFIGMLDEIRIWDKPLSESEILDGIDHELAGNESGLVRYWKFNESDGSTAFDAMGNNNDLTISGSPVFSESAAFTLYFYAPENLQVNNYSLSSVQFSWNAVSDSRFDHYNIYGGADENPTTLVYSTASGNPNENTFSIGGLEFGFQYARLTAVDTLGNESDFSNEINIEFNEYSAELNVSDFTSSTVTFSWNASVAPDFGHYNLYYGSNSNPTEISSTTTEKNPNENSFTFEDFGFGDNIYFRITEVDTLGNESAFSTELAYTPSAYSEYDAGLMQNYQASTVWGDYDQDGDMDLLIAGNDGIVIYRNDDYPSEEYKAKNKFQKTMEISGRFLNQEFDLGILSYGSATWFDSDNDGDLDIIVAGQQENNEALNANSGIRLFRNNGEGFNEISIDNLNLYLGTVDYGDYDGDGDQDLFVTGDDDNTGTIAYLYKNEGNNNFTRVDKGFPGVYRATADFVDYDQDGDLDIFYSGPQGNENGPTTKLYKNDGKGNFTDIESHGIINLIRSISAWADYDNDGDQDLLFAGYDRDNDTENRTILYKNNGDDTFTDSGNEFEGVVHGSVLWGDYDNDGDLDIVVGGEGNNSPSVKSQPYITSIYRNDGENGFTYQNYNLYGVINGNNNAGHYMAFGDYNNDGNLDLVLSGEGSDGNTSFLYENTIGQSNSDPSAPDGLTSNVDLNSVVMSWNSSTDEETNSNGLTYNVAVMREDGSFVVSPLADTASGYHFVEKKGNGVSKLRRLTPGTYYWKVQAIDASFNYSAFSTLNSFEITNGLPLEAPLNLSAYTNFETNKVELNWDAIEDGSFAFYKIYMGTEPNGGSVLDSTENTYFEVSDLNNKTIYYFTVTAVDTSGIESEFSLEVTGKPSYFIAEENSLPSFNDGDVQLGDYDKDGDLDVLISGYDGDDYVAQIYENHGDGFSFSADPDAVFQFNNNATAQFADLNNDGYLDVVVGGIGSGLQVSESSSQLAIYMNEDIEGQRVYSELFNHGVESYSNRIGSVSIGDFNRDGFNDIFVTGRNDSDYAIARLFKNNGDGTFSVASNFTGVWQSSSNFVDYNNDGWLDIFYTGAIGDAQKYAALEKNNGDGTFTLIENTGITPTAHSSSSWADYDQDGDADLLLTGYEVWHNNSISTIFKNNGDGTFTDIDPGFEPVNDAKAVWGDFDNDGDFDVFLTGNKDGNSGRKLAAADVKTEKSQLIIEKSENSNITAVYQNSGNDHFAYFPENLIPLGSNSSITVGDIDNDGDLDFINTGYYENNYYGGEVLVKGSGSNKKANKSNEIPIGSYRVTQLYSNPSESPNMKPSAPGGLSAVNSGSSGGLTISWNPSTDAETASSGLSYNIAVWLSEGRPIVSILSDTSTGFLYLPDFNNAGQNTEINLKNIPDGHYFVSVQSIDAGFEGSLFSEPVEVTVTNTVPVELSLFEAASNHTGGVNLKWATASETNNAGWEIESRSKGTESKEQGTWNKIGFVAGKGTTTEGQSYSFSVQRLSVSKIEFRLKQVDLDGQFKYSKSIEVEIEKPVAFALGQNYPNPFNPKTIIPYSVPAKVKVSIKLYDILGRELKTLENIEREAGNYFVELNGSNMSSGVYIYKIEAGAFSSTKKLFLMK